jgi:hypothetical protein
VEDGVFNVSFFAFGEMDEGKICSDAEEVSFQERGKMQSRVLGFDSLYLSTQTCLVKED